MVDNVGNVAGCASCGMAGSAHVRTQDESNDESNVTGGSASIFQTGAVALYLGMNNGARPADVRSAIMDATQPTVTNQSPPQFLS